MAYEFKLNRRVEFSDTDMAGIMHYSNFFHFMEATEAAFFRSLGFSIVPSATTKDKVGWPRVHVDCDFKHPLRFEDMVEIQMLVREKKERALVYTFIFRKLNATPVQEVARGNIVAACVRHNPETGKMEATPIPVTITDRIELAPKELFD
ncbi:MAG: thioesterase family protein [Terriglobia bacterium]